jgi:predicted transcriptional regulator
MKKLVKELMTDRFIAMGEDELIHAAVAKVAEGKDGRIVCVVDKQGKLCGIIAPKEILKTVALCGYGEVKQSQFSEREVVHIMTSRYAKDIMCDPVSVKPDDEVQKAIDIMIDRSFYEVPVVDEAGNPIGLVNYFAVISSIDWRCDTER